MAALLSHRLPLLNALLLLLAASSPGASSGDERYDPNKLCLWQPSTCGSVTIKYPFYLHSNETAALLGSNSSYHCGYPGLRILCEEEDGKQAVLQLGGDHNYTVSAINYDNFTVSLADQEAIEQEEYGICPGVDQNVTLPQPSWLYYPAISVGYLVFYLNCSHDQDTGNTPPEIGKPFNCSTYERSTTPNPRQFFPRVRLQYPVGDIPDENWEKACQNIITVPLLKDILLRYPPAWDSIWYRKALRAGFQLVWDWERRNSSSSCGKCEGSGGRCGYNQTGGFVACLCHDGRISSHNNCSSSVNRGVGGRKNKRNIATIAGVAVGFSALLVAGVIAFFIIRKRKREKEINSSSKLLKYSGSGGTPYSRGGDTESGSLQDPQTHLFSYEELEEATDGFNDNRELGDGGFGIVYKGYLKDGRVVAVKRLYNNSFRRMEQFVNEAAILSRLRHPNLVMFYGCTSSTSRELLLVYEFVANGTVADHLHGHRAPERALSWPLRLNIAVESAAALTYLHAIEPPIVHRDVKTTNILLDADFHVKVADFGLSRLFPLDATHVSTAPQGTPGYVDPEYHQCYQLTDRSDVYSFGVVLVELISSKPAVDITRHRNEINLAGMAVTKIQKCQLEELVDMELGYESDPATKKMMTMVAELAFRCLQQNGEMRPPIKEVLEVLKAIQGELRMGKDGDKDKDLAGPFSPNSVHAPWGSRSTTPNTSRD